MTKESQAIEVEVVEIDGAAPVAAAEAHADHQKSWQDWQQWHGRIKTLDARWWPLWVFLGGIAIILLLTVGLALAVVFITVRILRNVVTGFVNLLVPNRNGAIR